jgi:hypothetical protein
VSGEGLTTGRLIVCRSEDGPSTGMRLTRGSSLLPPAILLDDLLPLLLSRGPWDNLLAVGLFWNRRPGRHVGHGRIILPEQAWVETPLDIQLRESYIRRLAHGVT